ncbi:MAG: hypothetical protein KKE50_01845 [Nanoarchaeota archaeon]|nr:hypothetical protein [Nanoarchaeota archaeon]
MVSKKAVVVLVLIAIVLSIISAAIFYVDSDFGKNYGTGEKTTDSGSAKVSIVINSQPQEVQGNG